MSTLGERIKTARESKGYLQSDLAKLIGVKSSGVISNWEKDLNKPDAEKIVKICEVLNVSVSFLLNYYGKSSFEFTPSEQSLIEKYRLLDPYGQETINIILEREIQRVNELSAVKSEIDSLNSQLETCSPSSPSRTCGQSITSPTTISWHLLAAGNTFSRISPPI